MFFLYSSIFKDFIIFFLFIISPFNLKFHSPSIMEKIRRLKLVGEILITYWTSISIVQHAETQVSRNNHRHPSPIGCTKFDERSRLQSSPRGNKQPDELRPHGWGDVKQNIVESSSSSEFAGILYALHRLPRKRGFCLIFRGNSWKVSSQEESERTLF